VEEEVYLTPLKARDTDGTPPNEIIENMEKGFEMVILKVHPFGYLEIGKWEKVKFLKKAFAIVEWKTYRDLGAGNIYIGYSFDGKNYVETGPFNESENLTKTTLEIPVSFFSNLEDLRIRFRGEDTDFAIDAIAEVNIKLKVIRYKFGLFG
jgi:hypothetical protein